MQVILVKDVNNLGRRGDIINVSDGYARNYLLAQNLALTLSDPKTRNFRLELQAEQKRVKDKNKEGASLVSKLSRRVLEFQRKAGPEGHLYAGITARELAEKIGLEYEISIEPNRVEISKPIKTLGEHEAWIKINNQRTPIRVIVKNL